MQVRKPVFDLTLDDIARFPIWQYSLDEEDLEGQDEATVRPVDQSVSLDLAEASYLVRARFTLADGTTLLGLLTVGGSSDDGLVSIEGDEDLNAQRQPLVFTSRGKVGFWFGAMKPKIRDLAASYRAFGNKLPTAVFPMMYSSDVDLPCGVVSGRLVGFLYLDQKGGELEFMARSVT